MVGIKKKPLGSWFLWVQKESYMGLEKPGQPAECAKKARKAKAPFFGKIDDFDAY